jgi:hypothetical protein
MNFVDCLSIFSTINFLKFNMSISILKVTPSIVFILFSVPVPFAGTALKAASGGSRLLGRLDAPSRLEY